jgi:hypothetical protein
MIKTKTKKTKLDTLTRKANWRLILGRSYEKSWETKDGGGIALGRRRRLRGSQRYAASHRPNGVPSVYLEGGLTLAVGRFAGLQIRAPASIAKAAPRRRGVEVAEV